MQISSLVTKQFLSQLFIIKVHLIALSKFAS